VKQETKWNKRRCNRHKPNDLYLVKLQVLIAKNSAIW